MQRLFAFIFVSLYLSISSANAVTLELTPQNQTVSLGQTTSVDIMIRDALPSGVSAYDFSVFFDPSVLAFNNIVFSSILGLSFGPFIVNNSNNIEIADFSFLLPAELLAFQTEDLVIATLLFDPISVGVSQLNFVGSMGLSDPIIADVDGNSINLDLIGTAAINVVNTPPTSDIPEPGMLLLICSALSFLAFRRR